MNKIQAVIVADSIDPRGNRITSFLLTYPRFIHSELMTHRMFSRNSASSRAIPFEKMVKMIEEDPFIPIAWQKDHKGMQGSEYFTDAENIEACINKWLEARDCAIEKAKELNEDLGYGGVTKQLCNRLLEPFMWHTTLVTATELKGFFELRCPKYEFGSVYYKSRIDLYNNVNSDIDAWPHEEENWWRRINKSQAEIHIQALAEAMWDAMNESKPKHLEEWQWHIPFGEQLKDLAYAYDQKLLNDVNITQDEREELVYSFELKVSVARCARLSYATHDGKIDYEKDIKLYNQLLASHHMSPFEHVARVMTEIEYDSFFKGRTYVNQNEPNSKELNNFYKENGHGWCNNFRGFIPYRYLIENEKI